MENNEIKNPMPKWIASIALKIAFLLVILIPFYYICRITGGTTPGGSIVYVLWGLMVLGLIGFSVTSKRSAYLIHVTEIAKPAKKLNIVLRYIALLSILIIVLLPIYWMVINSFMPSQQVMKIPPTLMFNSKSTVGNYGKVFSQPKYLLYFMNSFLIAFGTVAAVMIIAVPASFSFSRYRFKGKSALLTLIMSVQMFPIVVILISLYSIFLRWNLLDNHIGVILADTTFALPLAITLMRSFFDTLPRSLDESARIDGAGRIRTMVSILLPLTLPGLVAVGIYTFLTSWDDYLMALTILTSTNKQTLTVGLAASFLGEYSNDYGALMAFSVGGSLPIVLLFVFFQKYMISGLTAGAVKG